MYWYLQDQHMQVNKLKYILPPAEIRNANFWATQAKHWPFGNEAGSNCY
jgi:hypothetical protein